MGAYQASYQAFEFCLVERVATVTYANIRISQRDATWTPTAAIAIGKAALGTLLNLLGAPLTAVQTTAAPRTSWLRRRDNGATSGAMDERAFAHAPGPFHRTPLPGCIARMMKRGHSDGQTEWRKGNNLPPENAEPLPFPSARATVQFLADVGDEIVQALNGVRRDRFRGGKRFIPLDRTQQPRSAARFSRPMAKT